MIFINKNWQWNLNLSIKTFGCLGLNKFCLLNQRFQLAVIMFKDILGDTGYFTESTKYISTSPLLLVSILPR